MALARNLFSAGQKGLGLSEIDRDRASFKPLDSARNEVAALVRGSELVMEEGGSPICRVLEPDGSLRALARE